MPERIERQEEGLTPSRAAIRFFGAPSLAEGGAAFREECRSAYPTRAAGRLKALQVKALTVELTGFDFASSPAPAARGARADPRSIAELYQISDHDPAMPDVSGSGIDSDCDRSVAMYATRAPGTDVPKTHFSWSGSHRGALRRERPTFRSSRLRRRNAARRTRPAASRARMNMDKIWNLAERSNRKFAARRWAANTALARGVAQLRQIGRIVPTRRLGRSRTALDSFSNFATVHKPSGSGSCRIMADNGDFGGIS